MKGEKQMLINYSKITKRTWMGRLLLLFLCLPFKVNAQDISPECKSIYGRFTQNYKSNQPLAYEIGKEYVRKCPTDNVYGTYIKRYMEAYERGVAAPKPTPVQSNPSSSTRILEQSESQAFSTIAMLGRYYALVVGNNNYQYLTSLRTAETDARVIESVLRDKFRFETKLLLNATRQDIFSAIGYYRRALDQNDNLLIYYAGHGYFDRDADKAYWLPVDARRDDSANWISADDITSNIRAVPAKHVLIVSDSCYSGTIYRGTELAVSEPIARERFLQKMISGKSRTLMASGGNEPVADGGGGGHSVFARAFLVGLNQTDKDKFTASELFRDFVQERVAGGANQTPEYNPLRNSGHESGDFVFTRRR